MPFTLGQRWISDTESELGLGTVVAVDTRMVTLLFPATGENRLYARNDSPITRVVFNPGDTITSHEGWQLNVDEVTTANGVVSYIGTRLDTAETGVVLREVMLDSKLVFGKPQDRLVRRAAGPHGPLRAALPRAQVSKRAVPPGDQRPARYAHQPDPHQLHIAHDVGRRHARACCWRMRWAWVKPLKRG